MHAAPANTVTQKLLLPGGRQDAVQSAVMTQTDGEPVFLFQTDEQVLKLKDKHMKLGLCRETNTLPRSHARWLDSVDQRCLEQLMD